MTDYPLWELFFSALLSSTLLPGSSEAVLVYLTMANRGDPLLLVLVATLGNTLGAMFSWLLGYWLGFRFPARQLAAKYSHSLDRLRRWGSPALLLSWLPIIGDPLCLAAGWLRIHWLASLLMITAGKGARYAAIVYLLN